MLALMMAVQALPTGRPLAAPVPLTPAITRTMPSAAARALSVAAVASLPTDPVMVALQCLVGEDGGLDSCVAAADGGTGDAALFRQRVAARFGAPPAEPLLAAAFERARFYRVALPAARVGRIRTVIVRIPVSAADRPAQGPSTRPVDKTEVVIEIDPAIDIRSFYPPAARRNGSSARMTATCRVLADRSLLCRDARPDMPASATDTAWRAPQFDPDFARATLRVFATMRAAPELRSGGTSIGREAPLTMSWQLP